MTSSFSISVCRRWTGSSVLRRWREAERQMPVLILTARGAWPERVEGIDAGADDYLAKPFRMEELIARVRALIRRSTGHGAPVIEAGDFSLDTRHMQVLCRGVPVSLSPLEYRLIAYLVHQKGRVVSPAELIEHSMAMVTRERRTRLRRSSRGCEESSGPNAIETRRGFGYALLEDAGVSFGRSASDCFSPPPFPYCSRLLSPPPDWLGSSSAMSSGGSTQSLKCSSISLSAGCNVSLRRKIEVVKPAFKSALRAAPLWPLLADRDGAEWPGAELSLALGFSARIPRSGRG